MNEEFDIQLTAKDLYGFNMYQTYSGIHGWVSVLISIIVFAMAVISFGNVSAVYTAIYIIAGIFILVYIPGTLWLRVNATMKTNTVLAGVLHYTVKEDVLSVSQGEELAELPWDDVYKVVSNNKRVLIYSSRINAYVIPREQLGDHYEPLMKFLKDKLPKYRLKIK